MIGGYCTDRYPRCVAGHRFHCAPFINEAIARCQYREHKNGPECGKRLYAVRLVRWGEPRAAATDNVMWWVSELSDELYRLFTQEPATSWPQRMALIQPLPNVRDHDFTQEVG